MAVTTTKEFLAVCRKSGLLDDDQQAEAEQWTKQTDDPKRMAATMAKREWVTRWQAHQLLNGRKTFTMGKYQLIDLLGRRGMGNVFLAQHTTMNRKVALKIVSKKIGQDPQLLKRFLDEARAIATLDHDNIVRAYSVDKEGDCYYIVMEYVEGRDLEDIVRHDGPLDSETAAAFIQQAADGLAHAHEKKLIHGDIKPSSLLMAADGTLKITDVGISEFTFGNKDDSGEQKQLEPIAVNYTAPELSGDDPLPDPRSDIYSLGCTLYFLLTGQPPFPEGSALERMEKHRSEAPEPILNKRPDVSKNLAKVCRKMMAKDAAERFRAAGIVQKVLAEVVQMEQANRRKSTEDAAPPPPRDAKAAAPAIAVARGKGNGEPAGKKTPAVAAKKRAPAAAAAAPDDAGGKPAAGKKQAAAAPKKKKSAGGPAFDFLEKSDTETVAATPTIQVGKRRKKTAAKPAKAAAAVAVAAAPAKAAAAAEPEAAPARQPGSKSSFFQRNSRWLIIGGAVVLCLLLVGGGVAGTIWFFSGDDDDKTVAEEDDSKNDGQTAADDEGGSSDRDDEGGSVDRDDEGGSVRDDEGDVAGTDDEGDEPGSGEVAVDSPTDGSDDAMASANGTDGTPSDDGGTTDDPGEEPPDDGTDGDDPGDDSDDDPGEETTTPDEPGESTPDEDPPPPDEPKEEPKPPPKPKTPFKNFTPDVTLAAADAEGGADPQKLTGVEVADDTIWFVTLLGGEDIGKGKQLKLNANGEDGAKARWTLDLETPAKGQVAASTAQVGNVWYDGGNLMFQWTKEGTEVPAGVMESCLVQIDVEAESRTLSMIKPQMVEPLVIDFQKKAAPVKIEFENLPDSDNLKLEITRLEGVKAEMQLDPNGPVPVRTPANVKIMLTDAFQNVVPGAAFRVTLASSRGNLTVSQMLSYSIAGEAAVRQMRLRFPLPPDGRNAVEGKIKELEGMMKGKQGQGLRGEERAKVQQGMQFGSLVLGFDDFVKAANGVAKIHYRIFMEVEGRQVDLVRTEPPKPADAAKKGGGNKI